MLTPPFLKPGDKIGIIAPARKISADLLYPGIKLFESWKLKPVLGKNIYADYNQFAGADELRKADLEAMLNNPEIRAIFCARGGYGTARILDKLLVEGFRKNPKWIIGYSDITALHSFTRNMLSCETIHATMPINYSTNDCNNPSWEELKKLLFGEIPSFHIEHTDLNQQGKATGFVTGGNLSVLYSLAGTPFDVNPDDAILFIEDLDEYLYHIDRMMMNLKLSGKLGKIKGLIVGGMSDMKDNTIPFGKTAYEIVHEHISPYSIPVAFHFPAGHTQPNLPFILGRKAELHVTSTGASLRYL